MPNLHHTAHKMGIGHRDPLGVKSLAGAGDSHDLAANG